MQHIITKAETSWLRNDEVLSILEFFVERRDRLVFPDVAAHQPAGGSLFIFSRKKCRSFRADKHQWRKKPDNKTIKETHEKLKVGVKETLNCYYAHADTGDGLQRRCYWILDKALDDVVMVHYLCSDTTRAVVPGKARAAPPRQQPDVRPRNLPQRAASLKARKYTNLDSSSSEELERGKGRESNRGIVGRNTQQDELEDTLDPMDSFMAKLPEDLGTFTSKDVLNMSVDTLGLTHEELSRMLMQGATSPGKESQLLAGTSALLGGTSISKEDLLGMLMNDSQLFGSSIQKGRERDNARRQEKHHPSLQVSGMESLLKGFSRLESLEDFLKKGGSVPNNLDAVGGVADFPSVAPGLSEEGSERPGDGRVSTIRRVMAPSGGTGGQSHFQNLASGSLGLGSQANPGGESDRKTRVNPTTTKKDYGRAKADAAKDKVDFNLKRRESLLRKVRNGLKDGASADPGGPVGGLINEEDRHNSSGDIMIEPSNVLFRSASHLVSTSRSTISVKDRSVSPEKTRALLKTMSIDDREPGDLLPSANSVEMREGDAEPSGFCSAVLEDEE